MRFANACTNNININTKYNLCYFSDIMIVLINFVMAEKLNDVNKRHLGRFKFI